MAISNNDEYKVNMGPAWELITAFERMLNGIGEIEVEDIFLKTIALQSCKSHPRTALHRLLYYFAYQIYYSDDMDWAHSDEDEVNWYKYLASYMGVKISKQCKNINTVSNILNDKVFRQGLNRFVDSAFAVLWNNKKLLYKFNLLLAEKVKTCKKKDHPKILSKDGVIARANQSSWPQWVKKQILYRDRGYCQYCYRQVSSIDMLNDVYDIDHMVPLEQGGTYDPTNLILSCRPCNRSKGKKYKPVEDVFCWPKKPDFKRI